MKIIDILADLMLMRGTPSYIRSDIGTEFTETKQREWLSEFQVATAYIEPGSPWENRYCEGFDSKMRDGDYDLNMKKTL